MVSGKEIRQQFIDFFVDRGHKFVPSSPVVPIDDPTLLFTNAGMNQFKDIFLGLKDADMPSAVNSQKCIRAGGKHNDLDDVGKDGYHHTFFEMLGNWSFGDYYKKEAIKWAWELFTEVWKLPKDKLHATVYMTDDEAMELWKTETDIEHSHITKHGDKDNFWEMGETGPCGPCSEIHMDRGEAHCDLKDVAGHECRVNGDCHRYIELWNLVFMQYNRGSDGSLTPLKNKFVDTGAGFERLCQVLQGVDSNYDTDVFTPIIKELSVVSGQWSVEMAHRVIADHIRTLCFAIADGGMPSNEGRGYVLRRILRRAARYGRNLNLNEPFLYKLVDVVAQNMGEYYGELRERCDYIKMIIKGEEERFNQTLDKGLSLFEELVKELHGNTISGKDAFILYDRYGFPLDLTKILAEERGLLVDEDGFAEEMEKQKQKAREASNFRLNIDDVEWVVLGEDVPTEFVGYETDTCESRILRFAYMDETKVKVVLDKTPFYAESGGQVADVGCLTDPDVEIAVYNVQKEGDVFIHYGTMKDGLITNKPVRAAMSKEHREKIAHNHTATHILHLALKKVLGEHVQQKGSLVDSSGLRFDFTHFAALTPVEFDTVERVVNTLIREYLPVCCKTKNIEEAKKEGAVALFGEKYGDEVRVVSVGAVSKELCGGTHVQNTKEIGSFKILSEASIAAGVRRIEAITGEMAENFVHETECLLNSAMQKLSANRKNVLEKIDKLFADNKELLREIETLKSQNSAGLIDELVQKKSRIASVDCVCSLIKAGSADDMKAMGDKLKDKLGSGIGVLVAEIEGKVSILVAVTKDLCDKAPAGKIVGELALLVDGRGGGRPDMAMAGGKAVEKIETLMNEIPNVLKKYCAL